MTFKKLNGQMLHDAFKVAYGNDRIGYSRMPERAKEAYERAAAYIRQELSLCDGCGQQAPPLLEITDLNLCVECVTPGYNPKAIYQIIEEDTEGKQASIEAPGEEIEKQAIEKLTKMGWRKHITMMKGWTFLDPKNIFRNAETLQELVTLVERAQLETAKQEKQETIYYTVQLSKSGFPVRFFKDGKEYTFGSGFDDPGESSQVFQSTYPGHTLKYMDEEAFTAMITEKLYKSPLRQYLVQYGDADTDVAGSENIADIAELIAEYVEHGCPFQIEIWNTHLETVGTGEYIREKDETITTLNEAGEAIGLNDRLYEWAFKNA